MAAGSGGNGKSLRNNHDQVSSKVGVERLAGRNQSDVCPKSPLLIMNPQETQLLSGGSGTQSLWVETPFPVPRPDIFKSSPTVPFSLQEYLNDENGLERCIAGMPGQDRCSSSQERQAGQQASQLDTHRPSPVAVADPATNTGFFDSEYIEVDYAGLASARGYEAATTTTTDDLSGMERNEVTSLDSWSTLSCAPLTGSSSSSSTHSSSHSLLDPSYAPCSNSLRYESLHRQLQEAGLAGLGDGTNSIQLYHR
ncbi:uncharacterized protein G6M90_00g026580 [Metarhizium brunneum]|uniref:Uncharacterized protein n=1 Tax=Metarhizium brunneum TaxID=500148 RepID=A0A7D5UPD5_9HYPO|nr:hypothetical protein G6M90_00g026580 [Metarhizium brunneum]